MTTEIAPGSRLLLQPMRLFAAFASLFLAAVCTSACAGAGDAVTSTGDAAPSFRALVNAAHAERTEPGAVVAADEAAYRKAWDSMLGSGEPPAVDFTTETAVFLFGGQRPTGGYSVEVRGVTLEGETLVVDGAVQGPPAGSMTTQALTSPHVVIAVQSRAVRNVRWAP